MRDDRVLVDQPGPHGRRGEGGTADVHGTAVVGLEPGDLGDRVAGDQTGVPVDRAGRRGEHHLRHVPPAAGGHPLPRGGGPLPFGGRPPGAPPLPPPSPPHPPPPPPPPRPPPPRKVFPLHAPPPGGAR